MKEFLTLDKLKPFIWISCILLIWEVTSKLNLVPVYVLPPFSSVAVMMYEQLLSGELLVQSARSIGVILQAIIISILLSIIISYLCILSRNVNSIIMTFCAIFNPLPSIAVLPLVMIWFGITGNATLVLVIHATLWPMILSLVAGFKSIPKVHIDAARNLELSTFRMVVDVLLFGTMIHFIAGIQTAWSRAWRALLGIEMIFGSTQGGGLGFFIYRQRAFANVTGVFVGILVIIIIGMLVETVLINTITKNTVHKWGME